MRRENGYRAAVDYVVVRFVHFQNVPINEYIRHQRVASSYSSGISKPDSRVRGYRPLVVGTAAIIYTKCHFSALGKSA